MTKKNNIPSPTCVYLHVPLPVTMFLFRAFIVSVLRVLLGLSVILSVCLRPVLFSLRLFVYVAPIVYYNFVCVCVYVAYVCDYDLLCPYFGICNTIFIGRMRNDNIPCSVRIFLINLSFFIEKHSKYTFSRICEAFGKREATLDRDHAISTL